MLSLKIVRKKIDLFHRPARNLVECLFPRNLFPFNSDFDFRFSLIAAELGEDDFWLLSVW